MRLKKSRLIIFLIAIFMVNFSAVSSDGDLKYQEDDDAKDLPYQGDNGYAFRTSPVFRKEYYEDINNKEGYENKFGFSEEEGIFGFERSLSENGLGGKKRGFGLAKFLSEYGLKGEKNAFGLSKLPSQNGLGGETDVFDLSKFPSEYGLRGDGGANNYRVKRGDYSLDLTGNAGGKFGDYADVGFSGGNFGDFFGEDFFGPGGETGGNFDAEKGFHINLNFGKPGSLDAENQEFGNNADSFDDAETDHFSTEGGHFGGGADNLDEEPEHLGSETDHPDLEPDHFGEGADNFNANADHFDGTPDYLDAEAGNLDGEPYFSGAEADNFDAGQDYNDTGADDVNAVKDNFGTDETGSPHGHSGSYGTGVVHPDCLPRPGNFHGTGEFYDNGSPQGPNIFDRPANHHPPGGFDRPADLHRPSGFHHPGVPHISVGSQCPGGQYRPGSFDRSAVLHRPGGHHGSGGSHFPGEQYRPSGFDRPADVHGPGGPHGSGGPYDTADHHLPGGYDRPYGPRGLAGFHRPGVPNDFNNRHAGEIKSVNNDGKKMEIFDKQGKRIGYFNKNGKEIHIFDKQGKNIEVFLKIKDARWKRSAPQSEEVHQLLKSIIYRFLKNDPLGRNITEGFSEDKQAKNATTKYHGNSSQELEKLEKHLILDDSISSIQHARDKEVNFRNKENSYHIQELKEPEKSANNNSSIQLLVKFLMDLMNIGRTRKALFYENFSFTTRKMACMFDFKDCNKQALKSCLGIMSYLPYVSCTSTSMPFQKETLNIEERLLEEEVKLCLKYLDNKCTDFLFMCSNNKSELSKYISKDTNVIACELH